MTWTWAVTSPLTDTDLAADLAAGWDSREHAEEWMRSAFADLLDDGADQVTLMRDGVEVYTMDLGPQA
ncbi:MAG: hypothetical protein FWD75_08125 [Propionibacteriaceae bacterium]|nr:hypothetical protein [Propionibacteriaceae bacterium]